MKAAIPHFTSKIGSGCIISGACVNLTLQLFGLTEKSIDDVQKKVISFFDVLIPIVNSDISLIDMGIESMAFAGAYFLGNKCAEIFLDWNRVIRMQKIVDTYELKDYMINVISIRQFIEEKGITTKGNLYWVFVVNYIEMANVVERTNVVNEIMNNCNYFTQMAKLIKLIQQLDKKIHDTEIQRETAIRNGLQSEIKCPICFEYMFPFEQNTAVILPCTHNAHFHEYCLVKSVVLDKKCPMCRAEALFVNG